MDAKEPRSAMFAEKKAHLQALEITLRPNIWRGFLFLASIVARFPAQDILLPCTCCESINSKPVNRGLTCSRFPCCVLLALSWNTTNENPRPDKLSRAINQLTCETLTACKDSCKYWSQIKIYPHHLGCTPSQCSFLKCRGDLFWPMMTQLGFGLVVYNP